MSDDSSHCVECGEMMFGGSVVGDPKYYCGVCTGCYKAAVERAEKAEGERDVAHNEALAAREARRMVEESNASLRAEVVAWKERAERCKATLQDDPLGDAQVEVRK